MPVVNNILNSVRHVVMTYFVAVNLSEEEKKQIADGLKELAAEFVSETTAKTIKKLNDT